MRRAGKLSAADLTWLLARRIVQWELEVFCMLTETRLRWVRAMTDLDELCRPTWQTWNHFTLASSFNRCRQRVCSCGLLFEKHRCPATGRHNIGWKHHMTKFVCVPSECSVLCGTLSICSYQCDNWYVSNWRLACHISFAGEVSFWTCLGAFMCCAGVALRSNQF